MDNLPEVSVVKRSSYFTSLSFPKKIVLLLVLLAVSIGSAVVFLRTEKAKYVLGKVLPKLGFLSSVIPSYDSYLPYDEYERIDGETVYRIKGVYVGTEEGPSEDMGYLVVNTYSAGEVKFLFRKNYLGVYWWSEDFGKYPERFSDAIKLKTSSEFPGYTQLAVGEVYLISGDNVEVRLLGGFGSGEGSAASPSEADLKNPIIMVLVRGK